MINTSNITIPIVCDLAVMTKGMADGIMALDNSQGSNDSTVGKSSQQSSEQCAWAHICKTDGYASNFELDSEVNKYDGHCTTYQLTNLEPTWNPMVMHTCSHQTEFKQYGDSRHTTLGLRMYNEMCSLK